MRQSLDIENLLQWAYRDELPKRHCSSAEGIWDRIGEIGSLGGIDPGHGAAQRYPHFGLPHPDAELIEKAVGQLPSLQIDWPASVEAMLGPLAALVEINQLMSPQARPVRRTRVGWTDRKSRKWVEVEDRPRDVLLLGSLNTAALVTMHAAQSTRPDWTCDPPEPWPAEVRNGQHAIAGECRGRNLYSTGSYCPLRWVPSPISIAQARADYVCWHRGLVQLVQTVQMTAHIPTMPAAPEQPWNDPEPVHRVYLIGEITRYRLPLQPQRPRAGPPLARYVARKICR